MNNIGLDDRLLNILRNGGERHVSGEDLCKLAGISRAAIWKHIEKLREEGYGITALPHLGYRLETVPDRLIPAELRWKLKTKLIGRKILSYKKVDSTNTVAYELAEKGLPEGTVIFAEEQAKGRGRQGRPWHSPSGGGIYMSCVLRPDMEPTEIPKITLVAAVAVAKAIRELTDLEAMIKWPNDILINGRKVCGILTEMKAEQDRIDFIILGIGLNVNTSHKYLPKGGSSLKCELDGTGRDKEISRVSVAQKLLASLESHYNILLNDGSRSIIEDWKEYSAMLGAKVRVSLHHRNFDAIAHGIDPDGSLVVRHPSGAREKISSGDVVMVR